MWTLPAWDCMPARGEKERGRKGGMGGTGGTGRTIFPSSLSCPSSPSCLSCLSCPCITSEIPARAELQDAALKHRGRLEPRAAVHARVGGRFRQHRVVVERVVDVEVQIDGAAAAELEDAAEAEIELSQPIPRYRTAAEDCGRSRAEEPGHREH